MFTVTGLFYFCPVSHEKCKGLDCGGAAALSFNTSIIHLSLKKQQQLNNRF